jgi:hypothetical protein
MQETEFDIRPDDRARAWLEAHTGATSWVIAYDVHRCCGGGKICEVKVREASANEQREAHVIASMRDGTTFLIDPRAARRLPARIGLTVRGIGRLKHLDLELSGEEWGELLYT